MKKVTNRRQAAVLTKGNKGVTERDQLSSLREELEEQAKAYARINEKKKEIEKEEKEIKEQVKEKMETLGYDKMEMDIGTFSITTGRVTEKVDKDLLKDRFPSVSKIVLSQSVGKDSLRFTKSKK